VGTSTSSLGTSMLSYFSDKASDYILPKTQGFAQSALYEKGINCAELVKQAIVTVLGTVLLSSLRTRIEKAPEQARSLTSDTIYCTFLLATLGATILAVNAENVLLVLFGSQWLASLEPLRFISIAIPFMCLSSFLIRILYFNNQHSLVLRVSVFARPLVVLVVLLLSHQKLEQIAMGILAAEIGFAFLYCHLTRHLVDWPQCLKRLVLEAMVIVAIGLGVSEFIHWLPTKIPFLVIVASALTILGLVVSFFFVFRRATIDRFKAILEI
jgi:O-antigen/teichoic acid export membrane protein